MSETIRSGTEHPGRRKVLFGSLALIFGQVFLAAAPSLAKDGAGDKDSDKGGHGQGGNDAGDDNDDGGSRERGRHNRYVERLKKGGVVVLARVAGDGIEVRYADGWRESVSTSRYQLVDAEGKVVVDRPARRADYKRLRAAARAK